VIAPSPYGRPARDPANRIPAGAWAKRPAPKPAPKPVCPTDALDREVLQIFAWGRYPTFDDAFEGFRPRWAVSAYRRCLDRGLIAEAPDSDAATVTPAGWEELSRGK
jgi:hypothetical protein